MQWKFVGDDGGELGELIRLLTLFKMEMIVLKRNSFALVQPIHGAR